MPDVVVSTWSSTNCQGGEVVASVWTVDTTQQDDTAITARRVTTETWASPSLTVEPAKVTPGTKLQQTIQTNHTHMFHCTAMLQRPNTSSHCIFLLTMFLDYRDWDWVKAQRIQRKSKYIMEHKLKPKNKWFSLKIKPGCVVIYPKHLCFLMFIAFVE